MELKRKGNNKMKYIYTMREYKLKINDKIVWYFRVQGYKVGYSLLSAYEANKKSWNAFTLRGIFFRKQNIWHI